MGIHPTAIIHTGAELAADIEIGPFSIIGENVQIGKGTVIGASVIIEGRTRIGSNNRISPFACIGGAPQDKKYAGEPTSVEIGNDNTIREYVTINRGTSQDSGVTRVGDNNWIMAYVHFAHDCQIGSNTIFANACQVAGHVQVGDWAILGATTLVHQFVQIGAHSFSAMGTFLQQDLPPYVMCAGNTAKPYGLNSEGLKRRGFSAEAIATLRRAYRTLYRSGLSLEEAKRELEAMTGTCPEIGLLTAFLGRATRGIIR
jgi:UDP-N-acetylglucosamine acyltransferase